MKTTILVKDLHPVKMTAKMLVFEDSSGETYMATKRVANDILMGAVFEVSIVETSFPRKRDDGQLIHVKMLATPSCW